MHDLFEGYEAVPPGLDALSLGTHSETSPKHSMLFTHWGKQSRRLYPGTEQGQAIFIAGHKAYFGHCWEPDQQSEHSGSKFARLTD